MNTKYIWTALMLTLVLQACVKDKITLDENTVIPGLTPSLAIPIGEFSMTIADGDNIANADELAYNQETGYYEYMLNRQIFHYPASQLFNIQTQTSTTNFELNAATSAAINAGNVGDVILAPLVDFGASLNLNDGELLDSIVVTEGQMTLTLSSTIQHNLGFEITLPGVKLNNQPFTATFDLDYPGSIPFDHTITLDLTGYTIDFTVDNTQNNYIPVDALVILTNTGQGASIGDALVANMQLDINQFKSVWGYLGQHTDILALDSNDVNFFDDLNGGTLYLSEPRIELSIKNTAGLEMAVEFTSLIAPTTGGNIAMGGNDLTNIPIITKAITPGDTSITLHTISNAGTSPNLSVTLGADPDYLIYTASGTTNPNGVSDNFILDTSYVHCDARIILPAFGYADNFTITDTLDADINQIVLDASNPGDVVTYDDIEDFTIRLVIRNGLPVSAGVKAYFADSNYVVIDSVFMTNGYQYIIDAGLVDVSLPASDPQYGHVYSATESVTDISFTKEQIQHLIDNHATQMIVKSIGFTSMSTNPQEVKFFPDDEIWIKVSAKVDFDLDLSE